MFSKFHWGLSQRAPCTDPSGVTDKGWIVKSLESSVSSQCWWAKSYSLGQKQMESYNCAERLQGVSMAKFLTPDSIVKRWVFMLQGKSAFMQHCPLTAPPCLGLIRKSLELSPCGTGKRLPLFPPSPHPDIGPGSLQPLWKRSTAGFSLPASCPTKCAGKKFLFCSKCWQDQQKLVQGRLAEVPTSMPWGSNQLSLPHLTQTPAPRAAAGTECLCSHWKTDIMENSLHPDGLTCQCISASWPKARGEEFGINLAKPHYFNRDRPAPVLTLRMETTSEAGTKMTPARWAQNQESSPTIKAWSQAHSASPQTLGTEDYGHICTIFLKMLPRIFRQKL